MCEIFFRLHILINYIYNQNRIGSVASSDA